jgi:hypothetical protein
MTPPSCPIVSADVEDTWLPTQGEAVSAADCESSRVPRKPMEMDSGAAKLPALLADMRASSAANLSMARGKIYSPSKNRDLSLPTRRRLAYSRPLSLLFL